MSKRALIVDDDPMIRMLVQSVLEAVATEQRPLNFDIVILDVVMPGMTGLDVLVSMKKSKDTASLPVMMLTGESRAEDILAGYNVGADYYITKPFTRQQLLFGLNLVLSGQNK